jgi:hypothetical protein
MLAPLLVGLALLLAIWWLSRQRPLTVLPRYRDGTDVPASAYAHAHIYNAWEHTTWGDNIEISNWERRTVTAHLHRTPNKGDQFRFKMSKGGIGVLRVVSVERGQGVRNNDLCFVQLEDMGTLLINGKPAP